MLIVRGRGVEESVAKDYLRAPDRLRVFRPARSAASRRRLCSERAGSPLKRAEEGFGSS